MIVPHRYFVLQVVFANSLITDLEHLPECDIKKKKEMGCVCVFCMGQKKITEENFFTRYNLALGRDIW